MAVTFDEAREAVLDDWPDYDIADYGYESDEHWFLILLPERAGGRIPAVSKTSGEITWINENAEIYTQERPVGKASAKRSLDDDSLRLRGIITDRAAGKDITPGHDQLHHYWTKGEGLAKWRGSPHPWTTLVSLLTRHVGARKAKIFASRWFHEVFGYYSGSDLHRVHSGKPPRGKRIGPG